MNSQFEKVKARLNTEKTELAKLEKQKSTLPATIAASQADVKATREKAKGLKVKLKQAISNLDAQQTLSQTSVANVEQTKNRFARAKQELANQRTTMDDIAVKLERVNTRIARLSENLRGLNRDFKVTVDQIRSIDNALPDYRRQVRDMSRNLQIANTDLTNIQDKIITLNSDVTRLSSQLASATTDRDMKYQEYITRYRYYSEQLSAAKSLGASQTDVAVNIATNDSNKAVQARSASLGTQIGSDLANAQGTYWSSIRAEIKGYNDGYALGLSLIHI